VGIGAINPRSRKAVFLDRDGVINRPVVRDGKPFPPAGLDDLEILPGVEAALQTLRERGFWLCVVTNQPDVARGTQDRSVVEAMHDYLRNRLPLDAFQVCYHDDSDACGCRKPKPGLLVEAAAEHAISLTDSYMIGDRWRDIDCGYSANCTTIFIDRCYREALREQPHFRASDLQGAARIIVSREQSARASSARESSGRESSAHQARQ
jgi:D-glycero-D-manno-heptose 1,7-bisphosphate phosphatase